MTRLITVPDAAKLCGVSLPTMYVWARQNRHGIRVVRRNSEVWIDADSLPPAGTTFPRGRGQRTPPSVEEIVQAQPVVPAQPVVSATHTIPVEPVSPNLEAAIAALLAALSPEQLRKYRESMGLPVQDPSPPLFDLQHPHEDLPTPPQTPEELCDVEEDEPTLFDFLGTATATAADTTPKTASKPAPVVSRRSTGSRHPLKPEFAAYRADLERYAPTEPGSPRLSEGDRAVLLTCIKAGFGYGEIAPLLPALTERRFDHGFKQLYGVRAGEVVRNRRRGS